MTRHQTASLAVTTPPAANGGTSTQIVPSLVSPEAGEGTRSVGLSDHTRSSTPALPAADAQPATGRATPNRLRQGTDALVATAEARAGFTAYLDRLEAGGYAACKEMAAYIARSREVLAAHHQPAPSSLDLLPNAVETPEGGATSWR